MWSIFTPYLIKFGISYLLLSVCQAIFMKLYFLKEGIGLDFRSLMRFMEDSARYEKMMEAVLKQTQSVEVLLQGGAALITIPVMIFMMYRDRRKEKLQGITVVTKKAAAWKYPAIVVLAAAMCLALNNFIVLGNLASYSETYEETMEIFYQPPFVVQLICLGILVPVCEELVFRGLMFRRMRANVRFGFAAVCTSIIFSIVHMNLVQMLYGFAMGMVMAYVYEKYGSVLAPITAHIAANVLSVVVTEYGGLEWMVEDVMRIGIVTVLCAAAASTAYVLMQRMESCFADVNMNMGNPENRGDNRDNQNPTV